MAWESYGDVILRQVQKAIENAVLPPELSSVVWLDFVNECLSHEMKACHLKTSTVHVWQNYARQWRINLPHLKASRFVPLYTGSYFEGMPNSNDVDMLLIDRWFLLCEKWRLYRPSGLIMTDADCYPGYIRILVPLDILSRTVFKSYQIKKLGEDHFLSSSGYIQAIRDSGTLGHAYPGHGPALSYGTSMDIVYALLCEDWPSFAQNALIRKRKQPLSLPTGKDSPAVYVVAVGHHSSANSDIEWRLSFSDAEKKLVMNWTDWQRSCYFLLKHFRATYLDDSDILCSYYMKTLVFWLSDIIPQTFWCAENFLKGFANALSLLKIFLKEKNFPHYFIPENNMISHKDDHQCASLLVKLENHLSSGQMGLKIVEMICQEDITLFGYTIEEHGAPARRSCRHLFAMVRAFVQYDRGMLIYEAELLSSLTIMMAIWDRHQCDAMESSLDKLHQLVSENMVPAMQTLLQRKIASFYHKLGTRTSLKHAEDLYNQSLFSAILVVTMTNSCLAR